MSDAQKTGLFTSAYRMSREAIVRMVSPAEIKELVEGYFSREFQEQLSLSVMDEREYVVRALPLVRSDTPDYIEYKKSLLVILTSASDAEVGEYCVEDSIPKSKTIFAYEGGSIEERRFEYTRFALGKYGKLGDFIIGQRIA